VDISTGFKHNFLFDLKVIVFVGAFEMSMVLFGCLSLDEEALFFLEDKLKHT